MKIPDNADNLAAVLVLGGIGLAAALVPWGAPAANIAHDIAIGLVGFLAKAALSPPQQ